MAIRGSGIKFGYAASGTALDAATGYTLVADVLDATPPQAEIGEIETTSHDTTGNAKTYMSGWEEGGEVEVTALYDKTAYNTIHALRGLDKCFQMKFSDGSGVGWKGYIMSMTSEHPLDDEPATMTIKTKVSGVVDPFAAAA